MVKGYSSPDTLEQRRQILALVFQIGDGPAVAARRIENVEIELVVVGFEREEKIVDAFQRLVRLGVLTVDLVDDDDRLEAELQSLRQNEFRLRHDRFRRIHQQHHAIDHRQDALHLAAEIGVAGRVHDVDAVVVPIDAGAFGQNGDAALAFQIVGIHRALFHVLIVADGAGLFQQLVHQRRFAVVDVGNNGDVANIHGVRRVRESARL
jgi:hypothetical protein